MVAHDDTMGLGHRPLQRAQGPKGEPVARGPRGGEERHEEPKGIEEREEDRSHHEETELVEEHKLARKHEEASAQRRNSASDNCMLTAAVPRRN